VVLACIAGIARAGSYDDCILENMKNVSSQRAAYLISQACARKALPYVPAKCKPKVLESPFGKGEFSHVIDPYEPVDATCVAKCQNASWWDKKFGDCKP
jgi:hypothetical protein